MPGMQSQKTVKNGIPNVKLINLLEYFFNQNFFLIERKLTSMLPNFF